MEGGFLDSLPVATQVEGAPCGSDVSTGRPWNSACADRPRRDLPGLLHELVYHCPDSAWAYTQGCNLGTAVYNHTKPQQSWVILDFFTQFYSNGWGTEWDDHVFHPISQAEAVVHEFAHGYWVCTLSDTTAHLNIGMGTRNIWWPSTLSVSQVATRGTAWGDTVDAVNAALGPYASQVYVAGAIDAELSWATYDYTSAWAQAYSDAGNFPYVDYGDAAGCPPFGSCNNGYSQARVYRISYGIAAAFAFPEIYTASGSMAQEWSALNTWGASHGNNGQIFFTGTFTQAQACAQKGCTTNSASTGWNQLVNLTGTIPYSSDIKWDHP